MIEKFNSFVDKMNSSTSINDKVNIIRVADRDIRKILYYTYNSYMQYYITPKLLTYIKKKYDANVIGFYVIKRVKKWDIEKYINGKDYYFTSKHKFKNLIKKKKFLEYAKVFDNYYNDTKFHFEAIQKAYNRAMEIYSYKSIHNRFIKMLN